jgi:hypothetical protein
VQEKREHASSDATERLSAPGLKKPYVRPILTEYGNVAKLTRSSGGTISDGGGGGMKKFACL